jgi:hypothetical protein
MGKACNWNRNYEKFIKFFNQKTCTKRPLGRLWHRWEDDYKKELGEVVYDGVD